MRSGDHVFHFQPDTHFAGLGVGGVSYLFAGDNGFLLEDPLEAIRRELYLEARQLEGS
jgi:hypothetical protein